MVPWANQYAAWNYLKPDALVTTNLLPLGVEKTEQGASFFLVSAVCFLPHVIFTQPFAFLGLRAQSPFPELSLMLELLPTASQATFEALSEDKGQRAKAGQGGQSRRGYEVWWIRRKDPEAQLEAARNALGTSSLPALTHPHKGQAILICLEAGRVWKLWPALAAEATGSLCLCGLAKPSTGL